MKFIFIISKRISTRLTSRKALEFKHAHIKGHTYLIGVDRKGTIKKAFLEGAECLPDYVSELNLHYCEKTYHAKYLFAIAPERRLV